jgi:DNA-binding response OmpR family regulator
VNGDALRILVVDDDPAMVGAITALVGTEGHQVVTAYDGLTAVRRWREELPDLVLLDLAMPGPDGFSVAQQLRAEGAEVPIIVVSGERAEAAKVRALDLGADDYLVKPFGKQELLARIRAAMRRAPRGSTAGVLDTPAPAFSRPSPPRTFGRLVLEPGRHEARVDDAPLVLTPIEYRLLEALVQARGELVGHAGLLAAGWPGERDPDPLWLKPHLARLRRKLEGAEGPTLVSVRAIGWSLRTRDEA